MSINYSILVRFDNEIAPEYRAHIDNELECQRAVCELALEEKLMLENGGFEASLNCYIDQRLQNRINVAIAKYRHELYKLHCVQKAYDEVAEYVRDYMYSNNHSMSRLGWLHDNHATSMACTGWGTGRSRGDYEEHEAYANMCDAAYDDMDYIHTGEVDDITAAVLNRERVGGITRAVTHTDFADADNLFPDLEPDPLFDAADEDIVI